MSKIAARHLERKAFVYVRQSSLAQVQLVFDSWRRVFPKTDPEVVAITGVIKLGFFGGPRPGATEIVVLRRNGAVLP